MITQIKTKQDLVRALSGTDLRFIGEIEVVNDDGLRAINDKIKVLLRQQKKLHVALLERN